MSPKWKARIGLGIIGVFLLVVSILKVSEVGWWGVGFSIVYLILVFTIVGREPKRPLRPFKQRRLINTAIAVVGMVIAYTIPDLVRGEDPSWDSWGLQLFFIVVIGLISWFGTRPEEPSHQGPGEGTR